MGDESGRGKLERLQSLGVRIAVDDFGTGYSSLGYLGRLPIDILKVDRSFVRDVALGGESAALAAAVLRLAATFKKRSVAEGIETKAQATALLGLNCELGQGYFFARPLAEGDLDAFMTAQVGHGATDPQVALQTK
jgi:EAL domain-containing protein (putative c-di-GMP-specific phosphodiesterase class I)